MDIKLDDKRIKEIVYQLEDGKVVRYNFKDGEINYVQLVNESAVSKAKEIPTDREMMEKVKKSEFMTELNDARKRFKIDRSIADAFPDEDPVYTHKVMDNESLEAMKKIIEMDKNGKLDEIIKRKHYNTELDSAIKQGLEACDSELDYELYECQKNLDNIEEKILKLIRFGENGTDIDVFKVLLDDYKSYKDKKKEINDKLWYMRCPKIQQVDVTKKLEEEKHGDR